ncbi:CxxxxCH/CxxCH domain-containing protein [Geomonas oryzisoli]|uniref:CxxxxCH/CxxCH domain-containing protein n=2 Tax=Geomonas oryzisoli TaxID=2847992 RepID=A0ABX8J7X0_9BACT|nr:CxxxxCH/CxxCH domain-containing protein [Geomonas oryzisoli]
MKSYRRPGYGNFRALLPLLTFGIVMFAASQALAAPQYNLTCVDCHTMPPLDSATGEREPDTGAFRGNHQTHAAASATSCTKCHGAQVTTTGHRDGIIQVQPNLNGHAGASYSRGFFNQTSVPPAVLGTCSNVNCHFEQTTPEWGITALDLPNATDCGICHKAVPDSYAHSQHLAVYGSDLAVCAKCHVDHTQNAKPFQHATSAGRNIAVTVGSYAGSNFAYLPSQSATRVVGSCSNMYCHSSGQSATGGPLGAGDYATPNWGNAASGACGTCHRTSTLASGSHSRHLASNGDCSNCHVNALPTSYNAPTHADGNIDVAAGSYDKAGAPGNGYGRCSTASCHASPYSTASTTSPVWGTSAGCSACHNGIGQFAGNGAPATGSHDSHMALAGSACNQCHDGAVKDTSGGLSHTNGTVEVANDYTATPVQKHAPGTYTGTCLTASCHADPYSQGALESPVWGSTTGCASCHKGTGAFAANGAPATGSHAKHLAQPGTGCDKCHNGATSGVSGGLSHANGTVEALNYSASPVTKHPIGTYGGTCYNSCHSNGNGVQAQTPVWGGNMPANCSGCHGGAAGLGTPMMATGKHQSHMNNYTTMGRDNNLMCAECHALTVSLASNTVVTGTGHLDNFKDYSGVKAGGRSSYSTSTGICSNAYCHSSGQQVPVFVSMTGQKAWGGNAKLSCNGCHGRAAGATWTSAAGAPNYANKYDGTLKTANSHEKHTASMTDSRGCANCHNTTVDQGVAFKMRDYSSNHVNRVRDVDFAMGGSYAQDTKTCTNYCHSNVQAPGGNGTATTFGNPSWGANGSMTCASCHKDMSTLQENANDLNLGSHKRHTVDSAYSCSICHGTGYSASATGASHADGTINLAFTAKATGTTYSQQVDNAPGDGYGTCSTSSCHGRATRNWGVSTTLPTCEKCHGSANTAITSATFKDTAGSPASPYVGTHVSHLAGTHNYSNPITCDQCHSVPATVDAAGHMDGLPATLTWGSLATSPSITAGTLGANMAPSYTASGRICNNTYCHAGLRKADGSAQGTGSAPSWNDPAYLGGTGCNKCHSYPPAYPHSSSTNCSACHNHVAQSNVAFVDKSKHLDGTIEVTVDDCLGCHSSVNACAQNDPTCVNKELIGAHKMHTDAELFLASKKLSNGDFIDTSWIYSIEYKDGFPKYGCGFCHPMDSGTHKNGTVELDLDPSHSLAGTVKTKNKAGGPWVVSYTMGSNVVCSNVYCHSNGFVSETTNQYTFQTTPNWYATDPWGSVDRCAQCHGNSPNSGGKEGSAAHGRHVIGNHYADIFDGYSARIPVAGGVGSGAAHGDPNTSTTFSCNLCHNATVTVSYNDKGNACSSCHGSSAPLKGNLQVLATNQTHINGDVDVVFMSPFNIKSKAQLRPGVDAVQSIYTSWTRVNGYKTAASYDQARTTPSYVGGTCSTVACHNGTQMEWRTKGPLACAACHVGLPQ